VLQDARKCRVGDRRISSSQKISVGQGVGHYQTVSGHSHSMVAGGLLEMS
jgi:hypothetical protein